MFFVYKLTGALANPLGLLFLAVLTGTTVISISRRKGKTFWAGISIISIATLGTILLSTPAISGYLLSKLETETPDLPDGQTGVAVLVLSGGFTRLPDGTAEPGPFTVQRLVEGAALARRGGWPLILSGGLSLEGGDSLARSMERKLIHLGYNVPVLLEERSRTTWENMIFSSELARREGFDHIIVVTNSFHMKRSLWMARKTMAMAVYPYPIGPLGDRSRDILRWIPSIEGLKDSTLAWREWLGLFVYRTVNPSPKPL